MIKKIMMMSLLVCDVDGMRHEIGLFGLFVFADGWELEEYQRWH